MNSKFKKIIIYITLGFLVLSGLIGLCLLFKLFTYTDAIGSTLLSVLTLFVTNLFLITSLEVKEINKGIGIGSIASISLSGLLFLIMIWTCYFTQEDPTPLFLKINVTIAAISILSNLVFSLLLSLNKRLLIVQLLCYVTFAFLEFIFVYFFYANEFPFDDIIDKLIPCLGIIFLVSYISLRISIKHSKSKETITITVEEYNYLKNRIKQLEKKKK